MTRKSKYTKTRRSSYLSNFFHGLFDDLRLASGSGASVGSYRHRFQAVNKKKQLARKHGTSKGLKILKFSDGWNVLDDNINRYRR